MPTPKRLQPALLIGAGDVLVRPQPTAVEHLLIEIKHGRGLLSEPWIRAGTASGAAATEPTETRRLGYLA